MVWGSAAWREAVRVREAFIDVDHLLLGLVAVGGPAAQLLADRGFTLAAGRRAALAERSDALALLGVEDARLVQTAPRPISDLHRGAAPHAPMSDRAQQLIEGLRRGAGEREYLVALLAEPSGLARRVLAWASVDVGALDEELAASPARWRSPAPQRVEAMMRPQRGQHVSALRLEHYIAAPMHLVRSMASGPGPAPVWLSGGRHGGEVETCQSEPVALTLTVATALRVRFELRRGPVRCGAVPTPWTCANARGARWSSSPASWSPSALWARR